MTLEVSAIVPTFNRASLIGETLDSILAQTHPPAEVIVVDDGSTDDTATVVRAYGSRVRYHRVETGERGHLGPSSARDVGVSLATSAWIALCDSDDLWRPTKLERQLRIHAQLPNVEFSFTDFAYVTAGQWEAPSIFARAPAGYWETGRRVLEDALWLYETPLYERALRYQPIAASAVLISRSRYDALGGHCDRLSRGLYGDVEFLLRNLARPPTGVLAEPLVGVRRHHGNRSADMLKNWLDQVKVLEYTRATHAEAAAYADTFADEIQKRRAYAAGRAFAAGRFDLVRELGPLIAAPYRDWKTTLKIAVSTLPRPAAVALQRALLAANIYLSR